MKPRHKIFFIIVLLAMNSCAVTDKSERALKLSVQAGLNKGGITENTDMDVVPGTPPVSNTEVDAFSGATRTGFNIGAHLNKPLKYGAVESGMDYMYNSQVFTYADQNNMYNGVRELSVNQVMVPLTYNFILFKKMLPDGDIQLKIGYMGQFNFVSVKDEGTLPEYKVNSWSNGAVFGISGNIYKFSNGSKIGLYLDAYRGTQIYEDYYNLESYEMPGSSFVKYGIRYQFN